MRKNLFVDIYKNQLANSAEILSMLTCLHLILQNDFNLDIFDLKANNFASNSRELQNTGSFVIILIF